MNPNKLKRSENSVVSRNPASSINSGGPSVSTRTEQTTFGKSRRVNGKANDNSSRASSVVTRASKNSKRILGRFVPSPNIFSQKRKNNTNLAPQKNELGIDDLTVIREEVESAKEPANVLPPPPSSDESFSRARVALGWESEVWRDESPDNPQAPELEHDEIIQAMPGENGREGPAPIILPPQTAKIAGDVLFNEVCEPKDIRERLQTQDSSISETV